MNKKSEYKKEVAKEVVHHLISIKNPIAGKVPMEEQERYMRDIHSRAEKLVLDFCNAINAILETEEGVPD